MRKVLITGLGIGKDFGFCDANNMNYEELLINPEVLLWADKICIPESDYFTDTIIGRECKLVFSILEDCKLIHRYNANSVDSNRFENVLNQAIEDMQAIKQFDPSLVITNDSISEDLATTDSKAQYCVPRIASVYSSLIVADEIGASCLFSNYDETFLDLRLNYFKEADFSTLMNKIYKEIFTCKLPNEPILHDYGAYRGCTNCKKEKQCKDSYLSDVEKRLYGVLKWRNYDEMEQLRLIIDEIIAKRDRLLGTTNAEDIIHDLRYRQNYIKQNIELRCKQVKRFANLATTVSVPLTIIGLSNSNAMLSMVGGAAAGTATAISKVAENYESRNNWVIFIEN